MGGGGAQGQNIGIVTQVMSHCPPNPHQHPVISLHWPAAMAAEHHNTVHHHQHDTDSKSSTFSDKRAGTELKERASENAGEGQESVLTG